MYRGSRGSAPAWISAVCSESADLEMRGDEIVEQREHDEVEHDRGDHFVRAEPRLEHAGNAADDPAADRRGDEIDRQREQRRQPGRKEQSDAAPPRIRPPRAGSRRRC